MSERLTRPYPGQSAGFGAELKAALDRLGVQPGDEFYVTVTAAEPRARNTDPGTSHAAAMSVEDIRESQKAVLGVFKRWGSMIDEELVARYEGASGAGQLPQQSESGVRTRRRELVDAGLLRDTGQKRKNSHGRDAILWGLPEPKAEEQQLFAAPTTPSPTGPRTYATEEM